MFAFHLPGANFTQCQDGIDNREFGAGRHFLSILTEKSLFHKAIFVARWYAGSHLGPDRFSMIKQGQIQGGPGAWTPLTTKNEAPAPKFYKIEAPEWQF